MSRPRLIVGVPHELHARAGMWAQTSIDEDAAKALAERFSDYEVTVVYGTSGMLVLPPKEEG